MKKYYLCLVAMIAVLAVSCKPEETKLPEPVLSVESDLIMAAQEGGPYEIAYTVENPVENGIVSAVISTENVDWITDMDYSTPDVVKFNVAVNAGVEFKEAVITVNYTWAEDKRVSKEVKVRQEAKYDYELDAKSLIGWYYSDAETYEFYLSDLGAKDGKFQPNGHYYNFIIPADAPESYSSISLPEGTYRIGENGMYDPVYIVWNADLTEKTETVLDEGILTVTKDGDVYVYEARMKDVDGKNHYLRYAEGETFILSHSVGGYALIDHDIEVKNPFIGRIAYESESGDVMKVGLQLSQTTDDDTSPFSMIMFEIYTPKDEFGKKLAGTYHVSESMENYTLYPSQIDPSTLTIWGSYAMYIDPVQNKVGLIKEGTLVITEKGNGEYDVTADLKTAEGFKMTAKYTGRLYIPNIPGSGFSTLTSDYEVDMASINYTFGVYWGDYYKNGTAQWKLTMEGPFEQDPDTWVTQGTGEKVYFEIITASDTYNAGLATGKYVAAKDPANPKAGEFIPGTRAAGLNLLRGTYYVGAYEEGYVSHSAPAVGGELDVTNHGDGTYTIKFNFEDGKDHNWYGEWKGKFDFSDFSAFLSPERPGNVETKEEVVLPFVPEFKIESSMMRFIR